MTYITKHACFSVSPCFLSCCLRQFLGKMLSQEGVKHSNEAEGQLKSTKLLYLLQPASRKVLRHVYSFLKICATALSATGEMNKLLDQTTENSYIKIIFEKPLFGEKLQAHKQRC